MLCSTLLEVQKMVTLQLNTYFLHLISSTFPLKRKVVTPLVLFSSAIPTVKHQLELVSILFVIK